MYRFFRPLLFKMEAERAHRWGMRAARIVQALSPSLVDPLFEFESSTLKQSLWGLSFPNPIGLAAGFDKDARLLPFWEHVGFGFAEIGSVSAQPSEGNPRPRAFRLPKDRALINRMGLNNEGAEAIARRLDDRLQQCSRPVGVNIAKTHDPAITGDDAVDDYCRSFRLLAPHASYVVLNISCPNTEDGRTFENPDALRSLLSAIQQEREAVDYDGPLLVKLSPLYSEEVVYDSQIEEIIDCAQAHAIDGFVIANTLSHLDNVSLDTDSDRLERIGAGGLSGPPLARRADRLVRYVYRATDGTLPIIGVGGIDSAEAAYRRIRSGASLVQLYTGLVYEGPGLVRTIKEQLAQRFAEDSIRSLDEAVGADA